MSYIMQNVDQIGRTSKFRIRRENQEKAYRALLKYVNQSPDLGYQHEDSLDLMDNLDGIFESLGWSCVFDPDENYDITALAFDNDELGEEQGWMSAIAPYVEAGSHIDMFGGCLRIWSWCFDGKKMRTYEGEIVYPRMPSWYLFEESPEYV